MSRRSWWQTTLDKEDMSVYELMKESHGDWLERIRAAEAARTGDRNIEAFSLGKRTINQEAAIRSYMRQEGKEDLRGMYKWLESREMTYYDILHKVSP